MRNILHSLPLFFFAAGSFGNPDSPIPFLSPLEVRDHVTLAEGENELLKRSTSCQKGYDSCDYMNVLGYCCVDSAFCAIDAVGHVACCPKSAYCTGTVASGGFATQPIPQATASPAVSALFVSNSVDGSSPSSTTGAVFLGANPATTQAGIFVVSTSAASILPNSFYPFQVIPTTYINAAACSAAWTGCQTDMAKCTSYLGGGAMGAGVTISAPNFQTNQASVTFPMPTASAICASLSSVACSGLQVTACTVFGDGNAAPTAGCGAMYGAGLGAAVGIAGQWLWS